jgi:preprotein translocase subunit SecA
MAVGQVVNSDHAPWSTQVNLRSLLPVPGPVHGHYPVKDLTQVPNSSYVAWFKAWWAAPRSPWGWETRRMLAQVREQAQRWGHLDEPQRAQALIRLRGTLAAKGLEGQTLVQALGACVSEIETRLQWQLHDAQLSAAWWMLGNRLVEMATGEGKSVTVVLAAATAALAGIPVHVMTSNDYLARRDAAQWHPIYEALGLRVTSVMSASSPSERALAYQHDVVYVTAREVAFDHLRDRAAKAGGQEATVVLRGLCMAIIDEADSILIDEACTPLLLAQSVPGRALSQSLRTALFVARQLRPELDFTQGADRAASLLPEGQAAVERLCANMGGVWRLKRYREDQITLALTAMHVLLKDVHYLIKDDEIHIVDATTGRLAVGREWSRGLHQMVCLKEGVSLPPQSETLTQATYQTFFPRYHRLCGLSGTLWEERAELLATYGLPVLKIPSRFTNWRQDLGTQVLPDAAAQWLEVAGRARATAAQGRAVLVGTDTVADSEALSAVLTRMGISHAVLNARHDGEQGAHELAIIQGAGLPGAITVATHMAGRGTDIHLSPSVLAQGGLHVINTHLNASPRIDRQLQGRCARQGQPGSHERVLSWEDSTLRPWAGKAWLRSLLRPATEQGGAGRLMQGCCAWAQRQAGQRARWQRWGMLHLEVGMRRHLALAGRDDWA